MELSTSWPTDSEMGTVNSHIAATGACDELGCRLESRENRPGDGDKRYGDQNTDGSHSIRSFFRHMPSAALQPVGC